ncbi:MAG TPA: PBP1A family penicillin-binding protein [Gemmatimonadales bacterium]|nr:PBP1A family penicillin-binding protein [Gemmatimonadales bacterium]
MTAPRPFRRTARRLCVRALRLWRRPGVRRATLLGALVVTGFGSGLAYGSWTRACAGGACPSIGVLDEYRPQQAAKVYAADGRLITDLGEQRRTVLRVDEIAPALRAAFLAIEDKRFYEHNGIDYRRVLGAAWADLRALGWVQGFSTITMQLARNVWTERIGFEKALRRKIREVRVALELERTYSKDRILELYLNQILFGGNLYGVEAAAQAYFGKSARDVNVAEAALLAGIANRPGRYNPRRYPDRAVRRRNLVLNHMREAGYISRDEAERWKTYPLLLSSRQDFGEVAPYFVEWVRQQLHTRFGRDLYEAGYRVYTTVDLDMQIAAEQALEAQLEAIESGALGLYRHETYQDYLERTETQGARDESQVNTPYLQGALVTMEATTGYVRAMVGGRDFRDSKFNRVTQARRQAGSTFKPFVFAAAIRAGKPASYMVDDGPISLPPEPPDSMPWEPQNYEGDFRGWMTLRRALTLSRNLVAIKLGMEIGPQAVIGETVRFGISTRLLPYPSLYIGAASVIPLEMTSAFTAFATLGERVAPVGILRVEDAAGNIVWQPQAARDRVMDADRMWILTNMLQDVVDHGTAYTAVRGAGFMLPAAGKTGTTNDGTDVWFIGFTPELVTTVWMGFDAPTRIKANAAGGRLAAPAWTQLMKEVYARRPAPRAWQRPEGLITRQIDNTTGYLATEFCPRQSRYWEWFIPDTQPTEFCPIHIPVRGVP